ncbi:PhlD [Streptomyces flavofungini]|uniref:PhlD n=1 Tax=Streptomyces flavofungini TaxID=68200 RepID=UPI0025AF6796|nr:PhlD [Streptomyces flavofungini]WJV50320.1 PhlD [Streptomyces flavofungini]
MPAHVLRPHTVLGDHRITTAEIAEDIRRHHPDHPRLGAFLRAIGNCGVRTRYFTRPLDSATISGSARIEERVNAAFEDTLAMAETAAKAALDAAGLTALDVDAIVTTHTTSWTVPNLDIHLIDRLSLRPTVRRVALTTVACPGGAQALIRAADLVASRPGSKVLVVAGEVLSGIYHNADDTIESMIYKALFGDAAAATIVTDEPLGPGLVIEDCFEYVLPDSVDRQAGHIDHAGIHFVSTKKALSAADDVLPQLKEWIGADRPDFAVIHPGSPRIIADTAAALGLDEYDARHSTDTLAHEGNMGGVSVLRVLERTHADPPADGARGYAVAFGPGFATASLRCRWRS